MISFPPKSAKTIVFITPNDAPGTQILNFRKWSHPGRLRPWVLHAPGAMMTVVNTNSLKRNTKSDPLKPQNTSPGPTEGLPGPARPATGTEMTPKRHAGDPEGTKRHPKESTESSAGPPRTKKVPRKPTPTRCPDKPRKPHRKLGETSPGSRTSHVDFVPHKQPVKIKPALGNVFNYLPQGNQSTDHADNDREPDWGLCCR